MIGRVYPAGPDARQDAGAEPSSSAIRSHRAAASSAFVQVRSGTSVAVGREDRGLVRVGAEPGPRRGRPGSRPAGRASLRRSFVAPGGLDVVGLGGEARPGPGRARRCAPSSARMSGVGSSTRSGTPCSFFSLRSATHLRAEVGDGGRHHHRRRRRRRAASDRVAHLLGGPDARRPSTPAGGATVPGPSTSVTAAPRASASRGDRDAHPPARTVPEEPDGVDRLVRRTRRDRARGGPSSVRVGPVAAAATTAASDLVGLGQPAHPCVAVRERPVDRSDEPDAPRARASRRCARRRGAPTCPVCIAGASTIGPSNSSSVDVSRSSASPWRAWRARSRWPGAITATSASCASRTCRTSPGRSQSEV